MLKYFERQRYKCVFQRLNFRNCDDAAMKRLGNS